MRALTVEEKIEMKAYTPTAKWSYDSSFKERGRKERDAYNEQYRQLKEQFKADCLSDVGLTGHPKAEKVWNLAWDRGHSSGYYEVLDEVRTLAELVLE